jgi:hypothetical protein
VVVVAGAVLAVTIVMEIMLGTIEVVPVPVQPVRGIADRFRAATGKMGVVAAAVALLKPVELTG